MSLSPISFAADTPRLIHSRLDARGALWAANIKAVRRGTFCQLFRDVLFVESHATASVLGMEECDGRPCGVDPSIAESQQRFIRFLREQTQIDRNFLGPIAVVFLGHEYACEAAATAAYAVQRDMPLHLGVSYTAQEGAFERIGIDASSDILAMARGIDAFELLGSE